MTHDASSSLFVPIARRTCGKIVRMRTTEDEKALRKARGARLKHARQEAGYRTATDGARFLRVNRETYVQHENGNRGYDAEAAQVYADAYRVSPSWLLYGTGDPPARTPPVSIPEQAKAGELVDLATLRTFVLTASAAKVRQEPVTRHRKIERRIAVVGEVAAGIWREAQRREIEDIDEFLPIDVAGYERADLRAWRVVGPSMNLVYPEGRYVVTAHPAEAGLRIGDYVIVERHRAGLVEVTLKEFGRDADGIALWPRSADERYQEPIRLRGPVDEADQEVVQIVGVVVADYAKRERPPIPFEPMGV